MWQSQVEIEHYFVPYFDHINPVQSAVTQFCQGWGSYALYKCVKYS